MTGTIKRDSELTANEKQAITQYKQDHSPLYTTYYENNDNDFKVQLPSGLNNNTPVAVSYGENSLRFRFKGIEQATAEVAQPLNVLEREQLLQNQLKVVTDSNLQTKIQNEHITSVYKNRSSVSYTSVQNNIDLNYYICGQTLKEDLVFHALPSQESFTFDFSYTGLNAVLEDDNSVTFYDEMGESIFVIAAPFMFDSNDGYSTDVSVTLEQTGTGCQYILTPNHEWLVDQKRVYPVTLDPTIYTTQNASYILDSGVQQSDPNTNYKTTNRMYVGSGSGEGRIYFNLAQWPSATNLTSANIKEASLNLCYYPQYNWQTAYQMTIDVYRVSSAWDTSTITWNNQTNIGGTLISSKYISDSRNKTSGYDTFDVTAWVKAHYASPSTDYGIRLQPRTVVSSVNRACYISSDFTGGTALRPLIKIIYDAGNQTAGIVNGGIYYIRSYYSGKYVDVTNAGGSGTPLIQYSFNNGKHQQFRIDYDIDGYYTLTPMHNNQLRIDVPNGENYDGLNWRTYTSSKSTTPYESGSQYSNSQRFRINPNNDAAGTFRIMPACSTTRVMDIEGPSTANNAPIQMWTWNSTSNQMKWILQRASDSVIYSAFSVGDDTREAYDRFTWFVDNYPNNYIALKKHTFLNGAISKSSFLNYLTRSDIAYVDTHGHSGNNGYFDLRDQNGTTYDTVSLPTDIGTTFKSGSSTITNTPFKDKTKWLILQVCAQMNYNASAPDTSPAYQWAKALLGDGNRMHGVLSYYNSGPGGVPAMNLLDDFLREQWTDRFSMIDSWRYAHPNSDWGAVVHSANAGDKMFSAWTANTSKYSTPQIYLYRRSNADGSEILSAKSSLTSRTIDNSDKTVFFHLDNDSRVLQSFQMSPQELTLHQQNIVKSVLNPNKDDLYEIADDKEVHFISETVKMTNCNAAMSISETAAVKNVKQYLLDMNLLPDENDYFINVSPTERLLFNMEDGTINTPETVSYMVSFYQTYNGVPIISEDGPAIRMTLCKDGISDFEYQWKNIVPTETIIGDKLVTKDDAMNSYCDLLTSQNYVTQDNTSVHYQQAYVYQDGHAIPVYMFGSGGTNAFRNPIFIDSSTGKLLEESTS